MNLSRVSRTLPKILLLNDWHAQFSFEIIVDYLCLIYICSKIWRMNTNNRSKINILVNNWIKGTVTTARFLKQYGIGCDLIKTYKKSNWIEAIGAGAYKLYNDTVEWPGALYAIQKQINLSIHPGGKTALELLGYAHYLSDKIRQLYLFGYRAEKLPAWYRQHDWDVNTRYAAIQLFSKDLSLGLTEYKYRDFNITVSAPERAMIEMLYHFPEDHGFDECYHVMENLAALRPRLCQKMLEKCNSVKAKRMFLFMAEHIGHSWFEELDTGKINLGAGNRSLVKKGVLNKKYLITVPEGYRL